MQLGTVRCGGELRAARFEGDRVMISEAPGLLAAIGAGIDLSERFGRWSGVEEVTLDVPLRPPVVMCAGQNYQDHLDEKAPVDIQDPEFFIKAGQTIAGLDEPCVLDARVTRKLDYETELGVVIGKAGRHIAARDALEHVFGYVVVNDVTARDRQVIDEGDGRYAMALGPGKNFDGSTRLAGTVVTADEIPDPQTLALTTHVDGELRQSNSTAGMVFSVPEIIAYLSTLITLLPGTIIATGTPGGTGWGTDPELGGTAATPPGCVPARYLAAGDRVRSAIEGVGALEFEVARAIGPSATLSGVLAA